MKNNITKLSGPSQKDNNLMNNLNLYPSVNEPLKRETNQSITDQKTNSVGF